MLKKKFEGWTHQNLMIAADMWADEKTAREIADVIGTTKNAVLGKAMRNRNLFPARTEAQIAHSNSVNASLVKMAPLLAEEHFASKPIPKPTAKQKPLLELNSHDCRWPTSRNKHGDMLFCCEEAEIGRSWCTYHMKKGFGSGTDSERSAHRVGGLRA